MSTETIIEISTALHDFLVQATTEESERILGAVTVKRPNLPGVDLSVDLAMRFLAIRPGTHASDLLLTLKNKEEEDGNVYIHKYGEETMTLASSNNDAKIVYLKAILKRAIGEDDTLLVLLDVFDLLVTLGIEQNSMTWGNDDYEIRIMSMNNSTYDLRFVAIRFDFTPPPKKDVFMRDKSGFVIHNVHAHVSLSETMFDNFNE